MMVISFPLVARSVRSGIEQVDRRFEGLAATLGAGPLRILTTITLPLASRGIIAGAILGFSRALGEFGATIMVAGAIPGRTQTLAVGIYSLVETGREDTGVAAGGDLGPSRVWRDLRVEPDCRSKGGP